MSAPMPTRRAFRPDSQYYRTTRRQRLRRPGSSAGKGATLAVLGAGGFMLVWLALHGGLWARILGFGGLAIVVALALLVIFLGRR